MTPAVMPVAVTPAVTPAVMSLGVGGAQGLTAYRYEAGRVYL